LHSTGGAVPKRRSPPKASLKIDAIWLWYAAPEDTLEPARLVHRSFDPPPAVHPLVRGPAEQAEGTETERCDISTGLLPSAREAGPRTKLPAEETSGAKGWGFPILGFKISFTMWYEDSDGKNRSAAGPFAAQTFCCRAASGVSEKILHRFAPHHARLRRTCRCAPGRGRAVRDRRYSISCRRQRKGLKPRYSLKLAGSIY